MMTEREFLILMTATGLGAFVMSAILEWCWPSKDDDRE